ncbi:MAG: transcriptional regulator [Firmicutes bacterium]|nr:transcriptional regulator [Bacillota bacterium]
MYRSSEQSHIGDVLHSTDTNFANMLSVRFKVFNITPEQWILLNSLAQKDGINQKELSVIAGKNQTIVTRMLDILERKRFVERRADPNDRRAYRVYLTEKGMELQKVLLTVEDKTIKAVLKDIVPEKLDEFFRICDHINRNTEEFIKEFKKKPINCLNFD